jgi:hypothetical protein
MDDCCAIGFQDSMKLQSQELCYPVKMLIAKGVEEHGFGEYHQPSYQFSTELIVLLESISERRSRKKEDQILPYICLQEQAVLRAMTGFIM